MGLWLSSSRALALWLYGSVTRWLYDFVALRLCGSVALWLCGSVVGSVAGRGVQGGGSRHRSAVQCLCVCVFSRNFTVLSQSRTSSIFIRNYDRLEL